MQKKNKSKERSLCPRTGLTYNTKDGECCEKHGWYIWSEISVFAPDNIYTQFIW